MIGSRMEGGANVVCEALRIGVPVIASRISGNVGLLGADYPAYFPVEDERALARLLSRAATDPRFYRVLKHRVARLRPSSLRRRKRARYLRPCASSRACSPPRPRAARRHPCGRRT